MAHIVRRKFKKGFTYLAQREADKDTFDYNLLTKHQKRFVDKQLSEIKRTKRKTEEEVLIEKLQSGKIRNLPKGYF